MHLLRNVLDHLSRTADRTVLLELRWLYDRHDLRSRLECWQTNLPRLCRGVEENIEEAFAF